MKMETSMGMEYLSRVLNINIKLDEYDLRKADNVLALIMETVVDKVVAAFLEKHQDELLQTIKTTELSTLIQEKIGEQLAAAAIKKLAA